METKNKKQTVKTQKENEALILKKKSKTTLFWEKYPNGIGGKIINMRAVLR